MTARVILCADDFGRSRAIDEAILELVEIGHVTAVSIMVAERRARTLLDRLLAFRDVEIGLHITLSDGVALAARGSFAPQAVLPDIDDLTLAAFMRRLSLEEIKAEIEAQFSAFETMVGHRPHFVDAHQHAHVLPGIREAVLAATRLYAPNAWVRTCESSLLDITRRGGDIVRAWRSAFLSAGLARKAARLGLRTNDDFAGLYDLRSPGQYDERFPKFIDRASGVNHLVICHPAAKNERSDPIGAARFDEFTYLRQAPLTQMLARSGRCLGRFA